MKEEWWKFEVKVTKEQKTEIFEYLTREYSLAMAQRVRRKHGGRRK